MPSHTLYRIRYRCGRNACRKRFTYHKKRRVPERCPACKIGLLHNAEKHRRAEKARQKAAGLLCRCAFYPFPHVRGTLTMCEYHNDRVMGIDPTEQEWYEYRSCLETPRSGCAT